MKKIIIRFLFILTFPGIVAAGILSIEDNLKKEAKIDVTNYPDNIKSLYPTFADKCSKCHSLSRPITSDFDAAQFKLYVGKMRRKLNSGINTEDAKKIAVFLQYFADHRK